MKTMKIALVLSRFINSTHFKQSDPHFIMNQEFCCLFLNLYRLKVRLQVFYALLTSFRSKPIPFCEPRAGNDQQLWGKILKFLCMGVYIQLRPLHMRRSLIPHNFFKGKLFLKSPQNHRELWIVYTTSITFPFYRITEYISHNFFYSPYGYLNYIF